MKKLDIIAVLNNINLVNNKLYLINSNDQPELIYLDAEGNEVIVNLGSSRHRAIYISELNNKLKERGWNVAERRFITFDLNEEPILNVQTQSPTSSDNPIDSSIKETGVPISNLEEISTDIINDFQNDYITILNNFNMNELYFYNSSKHTVDILNDSITLDLITNDSDIYTNTLSLKSLIKTFEYIGISGKIDLEIRYTKKGNIYTYSTTFEAFKFEDEKLTYTDFIESIQDNVEIEYLNNVIKVIPSNRDVIECIISNCVITYGNIN